MDPIFMLTRGDRTVPDCLEVLDRIGDLPMRHLGFKDIGVDRDTLGELAGRIRQRGAVSYLEVVSTDPAACLESVRAGLEIGVDRILGGTRVEEVLEILAGSPIDYYPFPGRPAGHPTRLGGTPDEVAEQCARFERLGCAGADLLAYRATGADPLQLVRAARGAMRGTLIVAGSITSRRQVRDLAQAGADAFTVGTAVFKETFADQPGLRAQLTALLEAAKAT